jgi:prepilin signal peptidase PulO-like enzyme (type II secretory pathway)
VAFIAVALVFVVLPFGATAVVGAFLAAVLVVLSAVDIERGIIPNRIVLPATAIMLLFRLAFFPSHAPEWLLGTLLGGAVLFLPHLFSPASLGMGDVKLAMLIGAALGWGVVLALPVGFVCVFPAALAVIARGGLAARKTTIPFGPFMALGALIILFTPYVAGLSTS